MHKDWTLHEALNSAGVWRCSKRTVELFVLGLNFESDDSRRDAINTRVPCQHFSVSSFNIPQRAAKRTNGSAQNVILKCMQSITEYSCWDYIMFVSKSVTLERQELMVLSNFQYILLFNLPR